MHARLSGWLAALGLTLTLLAPGCDQRSGSGGGGGASGNTILIGEYGSESGAEATFGLSSKKGIALAVEEINAAGGVLGKPVEIKFYDTRGNSQEAGNAVTRLVTSDKVVAVLGEVASSLSLAGGQVAQQYGVPMVTHASTNPKVTQIGDMIFRTCFIDPFQGYVVARFARENLKAQKVGILYDQSQAYSTGLKDNFVQAFREMGGTITTEQAYGGGDTDFKAQLGTIRDTKPDAVFIPGYYNDVGNIALQARDIGLRVPLLGGDGWDSAKLADVAGEAIEGCYYSNHYSNQDTRPDVQNFVKKFRARNENEDPDAMAALGYDAAKILVDAIGRARSTEPKAIAAALRETKNYQGVTGRITIDRDRNANKSAVILQMQKGKPVFVTNIAPPGSDDAVKSTGQPAAAASAPATQGHE